MIHPYIYDKNTEVLEDINWDSDIHISWVNMGPETNEFIASGYSSTEMDKNIEKQMTEVFREPTNYLYYLKDTTHEVIQEFKETNIRSVAINKDSFFYSTKKHEIMRIDKDTREQSEFITKKDGLDFETIVYITNDQRTYTILGIRI